MRRNKEARDLLNGIHRNPFYKLSWFFMFFLCGRFPAKNRSQFGTLLRRVGSHMTSRLFDVVNVIIWVLTY